MRREHCAGVHCPSCRWYDDPGMFYKYKFYKVVNSTWMILLCNDSAALSTVQCPVSTMSLIVIWWYGSSGLIANDLALGNESQKQYMLISVIFSGWAVELHVRCLKAWGSWGGVFRSVWSWLGASSGLLSSLSLYLPVHLAFCLCLCICLCICLFVFVFVLFCAFVFSSLSLHLQFLYWGRVFGPVWSWLGACSGLSWFLSFISVSLCLCNCLCRGRVFCLSCSLELTGCLFRFWLFS